MKKRGTLLLIIGLVFGFALLRYAQSQNTGSVSLVILSNNFWINITHPMNLTYSLPRAPVFPLDLNVSASEPVDNWKYTLEELPRVRGGGTVILGGNILVNNQTFIPNTTINALRFTNRVSVIANNSAGLYAYDNVAFIVNVNNAAPQLNIPNLIYVCENTSANQGYLDTYFRANDTDENNLGFGIHFQILPSGPNFFVDRTSQNIVPYYTETVGHFYSSSVYQKIGSFLMNVSVGETDGDPFNLGDQKSVNVTVVEMNSPPSIKNPIGVQTLFALGVNNRTLYFNFNASDDESGNDETGYVGFNVSFSSGVKLFNITKNGIINFTANSSHLGIYNVTVCANDNALPASKISPVIQQVCGQDGLNQSDCNLFQLAVVSFNRPPEIMDFYPVNLSFSTSDLVANHFNVSVFDPDGNFLDIYWYVDGVFEKKSLLNLTSDFDYAFSCGVRGLHIVRVEATDGSLNASLSWNVSVNEVDCPSPSQGGGGGGGGGGAGGCSPQWGCFDWGTCSRTEEGLESGILEGSDYRNVLTDCEKEAFAGDFCGYQKRECTDTKKCGILSGMPSLFQGCYYTENPSCSDRIKNCHNGSCEFLIDCGGPCGACPTCSDGTQNQGEFGVDCGGPCPVICPIEQPLIKIPRISIYMWLIITIALLIIFGVGIRIYIVWKKSRNEY